MSRTELDGVNVGIELVTPEQAAEWLDQNNRNFRNLSQSRASALAKDMKAGRWDLNGESIKFDRNGNLIDGQHRLQACVVAGKSFLTVVVNGVRDMNVDTGAKRQFAQYLTSMGVENAAAVAGACVLLARSANGGITGGGPQPTNSQRLHAYRKHRQVIARGAELFHRCSTIIYPSVAVWSYVEFAQRDRKLAEWLFERISDGTNMKAGDPVRTLREYMLRCRASKNMPSKNKQAALVIKTWNALRRGESMFKIGWNSSGLRAEDFPEIV